MNKLSLLLTNKCQLIKINVLKEMAKIANWTIVENDGSYNLYTDILLPKDDNGINKYLCLHLAFPQYDDDNQYYTYQYGYDINDKSENSQQEIIVNGKVKNYKLIDLTDEKKSKIYVNKLRLKFQKLCVNRDLKYKEKQNQLKKTSIEDEEFIVNMNNLAKANNRIFTIDNKNSSILYEIKNNDSYINWDVKINKVNKTKWRVRISFINFTYYQCNNLTEVYKLIEWAYNIPSPVLGKF